MARTQHLQLASARDIMLHLLDGFRRVQIAGVVLDVAGPIF